MRGQRPQDTQPHGDAGFWDECWNFAEAQLLLAENRHVEAELALRSMSDTAAATGRSGSQIRALIFRAQSLVAVGSHEEAIAALTHVIDLAEPSGNIRSFLEAGSLAPLLIHVPASGYRDSLLTAYGQAPVETTGRELVESLTDREQQILRLMAARLSNREIADELILATTTIKWYSRQIYGKLGVNSRREAVERAQALQLI